MQADRSYRDKKKQEQAPKIKYEAMPRLSRERALAVHQPAMERGAQCEKCPLFGLKAGPVMGDIVENAAITIIGEAPGQNEIEQKRPFVGKSGEILNNSLNEGGLAREECTITNAMLCRPPEELRAFEYRLKIMHEAACLRARERGQPEPPPPTTPYQACFPRLRRDIEDSKSKTVLAVGGAALRAVADHWNVPMGSSRKVKAGEIRISSLKKQLGSPLTLKDGTIVVASYHPAFAMRPGSRHYMHVIRKHLTRAALISRRGHIDWKEPEYVLNPSVAVIEEVLGRMRESGAPATIDIETDKGTRADGEFDPFSCRIRCIGFGTTIDGVETVIAVPIRHIDGGEWWEPAEKKRVIQACMHVLNYNLLVGHNLAFDTSVMLRFKLIVNRDAQYDDTMLLHHDTPDNDLPHDLGFVGARYFEVPSWKGGADDKYYEQVTDWDLHLYNCLSGDTRVVLADGSTMAIKDIVRSREAVLVLSQSPAGTIEPKRIVGWHRQRIKDQQWHQIKTACTRPHERGLISTPDHQVYTTKGRMRADAVRVDDSIYLPELAFSHEQEQAVMGTLLGDSRLTVSPAFRAAILDSHVASLDGGHALASSLTPFKVDLLAPHLIQGSTRPADTTKIAGKLTQRDQFEPYRTVHLRQLGRLLPLFYDESGNRRLRVAALEKMGPVGLAWWYMDDGSRQNGPRRRQNTGVRGGLSHDPDSMTFATNDFPREDVESAVEWFRQNFGATTAGADNVIRVGYQAARKLAMVIAPYVRPEQRYKLPRYVKYPPYVRLASASGASITERVTLSSVHSPKRQTRGQRLAAETRWCVTVEGNHNFFTTQGLVKNCRDVVTTMRLYPVLMDEIYKHGTMPQYEMDRALAPVARDMGELGLFVDERKRGELSLKMNQEAYSRLGRLKEIVGDPKFNPASTPQIRRFLFVTKKHTPIVNTKGKDWEDGEDPSTNTGALTKLVSTQACDKATKDFINVLLEYRAYMKLKGTYIDKLRVNYPDWKKEFGLDIEMLPEVKGPVWRKYKMQEKKDLLPEVIRAQWRTLSKQEKKRHIDLLPDGVWEDAVVIPSRPAMSRLHTTYKLHVIPSGRMSTTPAVQNWPKMGRANMHEMIIAPPGHKMVGADLDQVELRLYAGISGDKLLQKAFTVPDKFGKPMDPHSYNAASLFAKKAGKSVDDMYYWIIGLPDATAAQYEKAAREKAAKEGRTLSEVELQTAHDIGHKKGDKEKKKLRGYAKTFAYLEAYGGEADKLYQYMSTARDKGTGALMFPDLKEEDVLEWHNEWHKNHPETKQWQEACQRVARLEGFTAAPIGSYRKRFFPGGPNKPGATFNHVIQGAAAEIANRALLIIAKAIPYGCWSPFTGPCLQVHDMICVCVPDAYAEVAKKIIEDALCCEVFGIKITATAGISDGLATQ